MVNQCPTHEGGALGSALNDLQQGLLKADAGPAVGITKMSWLPSSLSAERDQLGLLTKRLVGSFAVSLKSLTPPGLNDGVRMLSHPLPDLLDLLPGRLAGFKVLIEVLILSTQPALLLGQLQQLVGQNGMAAALLKEGMVQNGDQRFWS